MSLLDQQNARLSRAARLRRAASRSLRLAIRSRVVLLSTPLELGTPGSLNRYLKALDTYGEHAARRYALSLKLEREADALLT